MDIGEIIIALAMSLPYGSRIQDPSLLAEILDEVDHQNLSLEDVDPAVDNISDDLVLTDEETIWLRARLREEISVRRSPVSVSSSQHASGAPGLPQALAIPPRLEWDEGERRRLRRENEDGFLLVPQGARVGVHLNLNKHPFFNVKRPRNPGGSSDFPMETLGHLRALVLSDVTFYVGESGSRDTAMRGGRKSPYAGPVGTLTAAELPDGAGYGYVPQHGVELVTFNPRSFPELRSLFFCIRGDVPVSGASRVVMRDWRLWVIDPILMSGGQVDRDLRQLGLARDGTSRARPVLGSA